MTDAASSASLRAILHVDMDAFYVSVELLRHPELRRRPVVVGGEGPRGVVAAASYEARRFGVYSAMPSTVARRLCPQLVFLRGDHDHYARVSADVHKVFAAITPVVEPLALDEAFLDVTGAVRLLGDARSIGVTIRDRIAGELGLPCSVGVAPNKFLAKLASVHAKPRIVNGRLSAGHGVFEVQRGKELAFLHPLPVGSLWGVGPATLHRLTGLGVKSVADLARLDRDVLCTAVGAAHGEHLHALAWGRDDRPVEPERQMKSISHEETFATDRHTHAELHRELVRLADGVASRLRANATAARTLTLKVRFNGFATITRGVTVTGAIDTAHAIVAALDPVLVGVDPTPGVRLLGVTATNFAEPAEQLSLDLDAASHSDPADDPVDWHRAEDAIDRIRNRFGASLIGPASAIEGGAVRVVRTGVQQWGPNGDK
jgi:DNA polymerase IV